MTTEEHIKIEKILNEVYLEVANKAISKDLSSSDTRDLAVAEFRKLASNKILALDGLDYNSIRDEYIASSIKNKQ